MITLLTYKDFVFQNSDASRATLLGDGTIRLHTEPGDVDVENSGTMERSDGYQAHRGTADPVKYGEGERLLMAHSITFPNDFQIPTWNPYVVADFHSDAPALAANMHVNFNPAAPGMLRFQGFGGTDAWAPKQYGADICIIERNKRYDFVYDVGWFSDDRGWFNAWVDGKKRLQYAGPTLFAGQSTYFKIANYHLSAAPAASTVLHSRIMTATALAELAPLLTGWPPVPDSIPARARQLAADIERSVR